jgi:hypothetical protein
VPCRKSLWPGTWRTMGWKNIVTKAGGFGDPDALLRLLDLRV